ncbi:hypothetical protein EON65_26610 [archaeon]|nr:MAG: hypothetical protein EON65_26610 [archaeon]
MRISGTDVSGKQEGQLSQQGGIYPEEGTMTEADVFGKLSRIFETHAYGEEEDLDDLLEDFEPRGDDLDLSAIFTNRKAGSPSLSPKRYS